MADYVASFLPRETSSVYPAIPPKPIVRAFELNWCYGNQSFAPVNALLDSGADYSSLPANWIHMAIARGARRRLVPITRADGQTRIYNYILLRYKIANVMADWDIAGFVVMDQYLIGRNILSKFVVTMDGPAQKLRIALGKP